MLCVFHLLCKRQRDLHNSVLFIGNKNQCYYCVHLVHLNYATY